MVVLGMNNSRMKDYYDIYILLSDFSFSFDILNKAVAATFHRRKTEIPRETPLALSQEFSTNRIKQKYWTGFLNKNQLTNLSIDLSNVVLQIHQFVMPVFDAINENRSFLQIWNPGGPWQDSKLR